MKRIEAKAERDFEWNDLARLIDIHTLIQSLEQQGEQDALAEAERLCSLPSARRRPEEMLFWLGVDAGAQLAGKLLNGQVDHEATMRFLTEAGLYGGILQRAAVEQICGTVAETSAGD